jgi:hypothetical protein
MPPDGKDTGELLSSSQRELHELGPPTSIGNEGIAETRYAENRHNGYRPNGRFDVSWIRSC